MYDTRQWGDIKSLNCKNHTVKIFILDGIVGNALEGVGWGWRIQGITSVQMRINNTWTQREVVGKKERICVKRYYRSLKKKKSGLGFGASRGEKAQLRTIPSSPASQIFA